MSIKKTLLVVILITTLFGGIFASVRQANAQCGGDPCTTIQPSEGFVGSSYLTFRRSVVPCGRKCDDGLTNYDETCTCTLCHLLILAKNIYDLLLAWLIIVALVMLTSAGVLYIISSGNAALKGLAKTMVTRTLAGFAIFVLSWLIVYTILVFISADESTGMLGIGSGGTWYEFECETENSPFEP